MTSSIWYPIRSMVPVCGPVFRREVRSWEIRKLFAKWILLHMILIFDPLARAQAQLEGGGWAGDEVPHSQHGQDLGRIWEGSGEDIERIG